MDPKIKKNQSTHKWAFASVAIDFKRVFSQKAQADRERLIQEKI